MENNLIEREPYSKFLKETLNDNHIKIITGVRRSGKSTLLQMLAQDLKQSGISHNQIVQLNFEIFKYSNWTVNELYDYLIDRSKQVNGKKLYIFLDEIQIIKDWEKAVNSLRLEIDCEIFITGSNAYLTSGQLATLLSGRTISIEILPFSFREFLKVNGFRIQKNKNKFQVNKWLIFDKDNNLVDSKILFEEYLKFGGFPVLKDFFNNENRKLLQLKEINNTVFLRDVIQSRLLSERYTVSNVTLLDQVYQFILSNIGSITSINKIANHLNSKKLLENHFHNQTVLSYLKALEESFLIYKVKRYDLKGKRILSKLDKYYSVDPGLRYAVLEDIDSNRGYLLENIVFLELKRRGFEIAVGKINNVEIDFIARKNGKRYFIQVTESLENPEVKNREIKPFSNLKEVGRKIIFTNQNTYQSPIGDIEVINIIDFLLDLNGLN